MSVDVREALDLYDYDSDRVTVYAGEALERIIQESTTEYLSCMLGGLGRALSKQSLGNAGL